MAVGIWHANRNFSPHTHYCVLVSFRLPNSCDPVEGLRSVKAEGHLPGNRHYGSIVSFATMGGCPSSWGEGTQRGRQRRLVVAFRP
jgi:hypothetical protein